MGHTVMLFRGFFFLKFPLEHLENSHRNVNRYNNENKYKCTKSNIYVRFRATELRDVFRNKNQYSCSFGC